MLSLIVTHVITESEGLCCPRTLKCLSAICIGCWLLSYQCKLTMLSCNINITLIGLTKSLENGNWANEEDYLIQGFLFQGHALLTNAPKKCYLSTLTKVSIKPLWTPNYLFHYRLQDYLMVVNSSLKVCLPIINPPRMSSLN